MKIEDCYYLGTITKPHGLKGHLIVKLDTDVPEIYNNLESVFLYINGILVPFFISECQLINYNSLKIKFEDSNSISFNLIGVELYMPLNTLPELKGKQFYYHEVLNFNLMNEKREVIGTIMEINDNGPQPLFKIRTLDDKELYIPIINDWIIEVNREENFILINLPEGILDL